MRSVLPLLLVLILSSTIATDAGAAPATSGSTAGTQVAPAPRHSPGATGRLSAQEKSELNSIARLIAESPSSPAIKSRWQAYIQRYGSSKMDGHDVYALVQQVMRDSYMQSTQDLESYANKVKYYNEQKKQIRSQMQQQRQSLSVNPGLGQAQQDVAKEATGSKLALQGPALQKQQQTLETAGEDAQLANLDLQNALQKRQHALQQMSNMSKMLHDIAMGLIRKMK